MPEYAKLYRYTRYDTDSIVIPKNRLMVSLVDSTNKVNRQIVKNQISAIVDNSSKTSKIKDSVLVIDTIEETEKVDRSLILMTYLNLVISCISLTLAFFLLIISIAGNIRDSTYEIAVLRAIGMTGTEITNVYVLEALSNNIASILLGLMVGVTVSGTLGAQYFSIMEIPFQLLLPYKMILVMIALSMSILLIGTYSATKSIGHKSIAKILKSGTI